MSATAAPHSPPTGTDTLCEQIRAALAAWAPRLLGVHTPSSLSGPAETARRIGVVADAAEVTVLPGDSTTAREELHTAAARACAAADGGAGAAARAHLAAARSGCRRAAVALGHTVPITF
ncbi:MULTISPECIES: hypothetical protein [Streptomyces]|uniref:hypothetical protein n=1 Tax=Streptomyces TaxID=1883 RepID=UPI0006AF33A2|nr:MULTISPECIES: hypothetical protein [unclassified Streptomyces]KOU69763.1 hypothetical protein ADK61_36590 [Streptomyces sp. XY66]